MKRLLLISLVALGMILVSGCELCYEHCFQPVRRIHVIHGHGHGHHRSTHHGHYQGHGRHHRCR